MQAPKELIICLLIAALGATGQSVAQTDKNYAYEYAESEEHYLNWDEEEFPNRCDNITEYMVMDNCYKCSVVCDIELSHALFQKICLGFCKGKFIIQMPFEL